MPLLRSVEVGFLITVQYVGQGLTVLSGKPQCKAKHCILHSNSEIQGTALKSVALSRKQGRKKFFRNALLS